MKRYTMSKKLITEKAEAIRYLHMYYDLSEDVRANIFNHVSWDEMSDDREWHMQVCWEDAHGAADWFERQTGHALKVETVHGPGTEQFFPGDFDYWCNGPEEVAPIDEHAWGMCYEYDCLIAWNRHVPNINQCARVAQTLEDLDDDAREARIYDLMAAQDAYTDAINDALQDVCGMLNNDLRAKEDYTFTREFWENRCIDCADNEAWFTEDGAREYRRDSSSLWSVDTGDALDVIFENDSPRVIVAREYVDC